MPSSRLLYLSPQQSSFVKKDIAFLSRTFDVKYLDFKGSGALKLFVNLFRQFFFLLFHVWRCHSILVMFGGYHAFLPTLFGKIFRKKVRIILGGTDCVSFPSIDYGTFRKPMQGRVTCMSYRLAHQLLPVHESLMFRKDTYYTVDSEVQGCKHWCKALKTPFRAIYNGYEADKWAIDPSKKLPKTFMTIAAITDASKLALKGIDLILRVAPSFPECNFVIVGLQVPDLPLSDGPNITVLPFLSAPELRDVLERSQFYFQLSISEGFPNAICEGMLCECIPIGSNVAAIPEIIGETGILVTERSTAAVENAIRQALSIPDPQEMGKRARSRIATHFTLEMREKAYLEVLKGN